MVATRKSKARQRSALICGLNGVEAPFLYYLYQRLRCKFGSIFIWEEEVTIYGDLWDKFLSIDIQKDLASSCLSMIITGKAV